MLHIDILSYISSQIAQVAWPIWIALAGHLRQSGKQYRNTTLVHNKDLQTLLEPNFKVSHLQRLLFTTYMNVNKCIWNSAFNCCSNTWVNPPMVMKCYPCCFTYIVGCILSLPNALSDRKFHSRHQISLGLRFKFWNCEIMKFLSTIFQPWLNVINSFYVTMIIQPLSLVPEIMSLSPTQASIVGVVVWSSDSYLKWRSSPAVIVSV